MKRMLQLALFVCLLGLLSVSSLAVDAQVTQPLVCTRFQQQAFNEFSTACAGTEGGELCYGFNAVVATEDQTTPIEDFELGDKLPIDPIESVVSQPYARTNDTWGLSLLLLPDIQVSQTETEPNLRYILFGGVQLVDTDEEDAAETGYAPLQSFTFATDQTNLCSDAPSTLFIQSDCGFADRRFRAEGVDFTIDGAVVLTGGGTSGYIQATVVYGVLTIQPDVYSDGIAEATDQTQPIVVPVGYSIRATLNANEPIDSEDHVGPWGAIQQVSRQQLLTLAYLQNIPGNLGYCPINIPIIRQPSGSGGVRTTLRFSSSAPLEAVLPFCQVANPPAFCTYLGLP